MTGCLAHGVLDNMHMGVDINAGRSFVFTSSNCLEEVVDSIMFSGGMFVCNGTSVSENFIVVLCNLRVDRKANWKMVVNR